MVVDRKSSGMPDKPHEQPSRWAQRPDVHPIGDMVHLNKDGDPEGRIEVAYDDAGTVRIAITYKGNVSVLRFPPGTAVRTATMLLQASLGAAERENSSTASGR